MQKLCIGFQDFLMPQYNQFKIKINQYVYQNSIKIFKDEINMHIPSFGFRDFLTPGSRRGSIQVGTLLAKHSMIVC